MDNPHPIRRRDTFRVLVVEDEARMRDLLIDVLPGMGYEVIGARIAEEALRLMQQRSADIVVLDLNLPVMDGMTFLDQFRCRWTRTPVIIMTGFGNLESAKRAIRHNVVDFLTKPCHLGEIEEALSRARRLIDQPGAVVDGVKKCHEALVKLSTDEVDTTVIIPTPTTLTDADRRLIESALRRHNGNRSAAAAELGISRRTLYNRLAKHERVGRTS